MFFKFFHAQVVPTFLNAAEIMHCEKYDQVERVHLFSRKRFLRVLNKLPNDVIYGELDRYPFLDNSNCKMYKILVQTVKIAWIF